MRTNEIVTVIPLLDQLEDISRKTITADASLSQLSLATYIVRSSP